MISLEKEDPNSVVYLEATTKGGQKIRKELDIKVWSKAKAQEAGFTEPCKYSVDPADGVIVT